MVICLKSFSHQAKYVLLTLTSEAGKRMVGKNKNYIYFLNNNKKKLLNNFFGLDDFFLNGKMCAIKNCY